MHARVWAAQFQPGRVGEGIDVFRDAIAPAVREQPGCQGVLLLTDTVRGKAMAISIWETEADLQAGETSEYLREQFIKIADCFAEPPTMTHYEVVVKE